jgi:hypothetical protein
MKEKRFFAMQSGVSHHNSCCFSNLPELKIFVVFDWNLFPGSSCDNVRRHEGVLDNAL